MPPEIVVDVVSPVLQNEGETLTVDGSILRPGFASMDGDGGLWGRQRGAAAGAAGISRVSAVPHLYDSGYPGR
ncbi:MAG UNVERIFIED_CONTAM: hypothetical protein LVR18_49760 [Planctomycetaceae bacterium]